MSILDRLINIRNELATVSCRIDLYNSEMSVLHAKNKEVQDSNIELSEKLKDLRKSTERSIERLETLITNIDDV